MTFTSALQKVVSAVSGLVHPDPSPSEDTETYYPRNNHDIYHATFLLLQRVPPELAYTIVEHAEYWRRLAVSTDHKLSVTHSKIETANSMRALLAANPGADRVPPTQLRPYRVPPIEYWNGMEYLRSPAIDSSIRSPIRRIVVEVTSKDQGWSSNREGAGTRLHSWTWFELVSYRPDRGESDEESAKRHEREERPQWRDQEAGSEDEPLSEKPPAIDTTSRVRLATNIHAGKKLETQLMEWTPTSDDPEQAEFVRALQDGDEVAVEVFARYPAWVNNVAGGRIEVYVAGVR